MGDQHGFRAGMKQAIRADLLDFSGHPGLDDPGSPAVRWRPDHWLLLAEDGRIAAVERDRPGEDWLCHDHRGKLLVPGFIDTHLHSPQLDVIASWGTQLLDWLETYTFPAEGSHADPQVASQASALFLDALLAHGTTAAAVFPTVHRVSAEALFEAALERGMRLITGKVLMDRHAPPQLCDDVEAAERDCLALIERWHGRARLAYALTPRFAATSSPAQLAMAGRLLGREPGLYLQTHVAENQAEVAWVARLFPERRSYLDVYARHGLLGERSVLAHGIWLDDADRALLGQVGAQIAFCPSSNLFLGSGLFDWRRAREAGVPVSLASDVGGGTSLSMHRTMADGYKVQALSGTRLSAWALLHAATRGAAEALRLDDEIGSLEPGRMADLAVWDWAVGPVARRRDAVARELHERVFAWVMLGDERCLVQTWVGGVMRHMRG
jgi:guanine deaminase